MSSDGKKAIDLREMRRNNGIIKLSGKDFVTFSGLLDVSHNNGLEKIETEMLFWRDDHALFKATVTGSRGTFTAHGDASVSDMKRGMAAATIRMAETRAICRALRCYTGIGMTAREELPGNGEDADAAPRRREAPAPRREAPAPAQAPAPAPLREARRTHPSWARGEKVFLARLQEYGTTYEAVAEFCATQKLSAPAHWDAKARLNFLADLEAGKIASLKPKAAAAG